MNKIEIHPLSATIGAALAFLLLFACSSSGKNSVPPVIAPIVTTQVTFYSDTPVPGAGGAWSGFNPVNVFSIGTMAAPTVITDVSWTNLGGLPSARLLVNGSPVYAWGWDHHAPRSDGAAAVASRFSLTHGILVPKDAVLTVETLQVIPIFMPPRGAQGGATGAYSITGYVPWVVG